MVFFCWRISMVWDLVEMSFCSFLFFYATVGYLYDVSVLSFFSIQVSC
jgi:hypothetical protein